MTSINQPATRSFLRVPDFDQMQNPKRPRRPTWIKSFVRDLDDPVRLSLSLSVRGFLSEFEKLAASMTNRVPDDIRFIARRINTPPTVAGKALNTCVTHGLVSRFDEDIKTWRDNDLYQKTDTRTIPPSKSSSNTESSTATNLNSTTVPNSYRDKDEISNRGSAWDEIDELSIPF